MKQNTKKILTWLYFDPTTDEPYWANYRELLGLLPELTQAGLRSLVKYLADKNWLRVEKMRPLARGVSASGLGHSGTGRRHHSRTGRRQSQISLTQHGREALRLVFPVFSRQLSKWSGDWSCLVFCQSPKSDPQFRYLRNLLVSEGAVSLSRGVYLYPGQFSNQIRTTCRDLYQNSVLIFKMADWSFGDERSVIVENYQLIELVEGYSSLSNQLNSLLNKLDDEKGLNDDDKNQLFSDFDRFLSFLERDLGLLSHYFPQVNGAGKLLIQFRKLYSAMKN